MSTPKPQGIYKTVLTPSRKEQEIIRRGHNQAFCYADVLMDTTRKAATIAASVGAGSWTIIPVQEDPTFKVIVEFYNWTGIGIYNFDHPFISPKKKFYWWYKAELPGWWTDPKWKHTEESYEKPYDPRT